MKERYSIAMKNLCATLYLEDEGNEASYDSGILQEAFAEFA